MPEKTHKIVVTGMGVISPSGVSTEQLWSSLWEEKSAVQPYSFSSRNDSPVYSAAPVQDFHGEIDDFGESDKVKRKTIKKAIKLMSREIQMGLASAQKAIVHAHLASHSISPHRMGVSFGCDLIYSTAEELLDGVRACLVPGEKGNPTLDFSQWALRGMPKMSPLWQLKFLSNMPSSHIAIVNQLFGPSNSIVLREASIGAVVAEATETIRAGKVDIMLVGATGSRLHPIKMVQTLKQEEVAYMKPTTAPFSAPFDQNRQGMILGEGAGALILESEEHAKKRGATIHAEIVCACSGIVPPGSNQPDYQQSVLVQVLKKTLGKSGCDPSALGHINAHGLGTHSADVAEAKAIVSVFEKRLKPIPVTTAKGHFGNLGAGGGAVELIAGILALEKGRLFPILNHRQTDSACPVHAVQSGMKTPSGTSFIKLSFNHQGQASAILVRK